MSLFGEESRELIPLRTPKEGSNEQRHFNTCGGTEGYVTEKNGQAVVRCARCDLPVYNKPKPENERRSVASRPDIKPSRRTEILALDGNRCVHCGRGPAEGVILHVGHFLTITEGRALGATDDELGSDENLFAECEECNLGAGSKTRPLRIHLLILRARRARAAT